MGKLIQFETSAINLALSLREEIRQQEICITDEFDTPAGKLVVSDLKWPIGWVRTRIDETKTVLRREPFNSDPIINYLSGKRVQLVQPVEVSLSSIPELMQAGAATPTTTQVLKLALVFSLRVYNVDNDISLSIGYDGIEGLPEGIPSLDTLKKRIAEVFVIKKIPLDVGKLSGLGSKPKVANADIAAVVSSSPSGPEGTPVFEPEESFVAIRIELGNYPVDVGLWETFYAATNSMLFMTQGRGGFIPRERSWTIFTDEFFLVESTRSGVEESFKSSGEFQLQGGIAASWSAPDGDAHIHLDFHGKAINACDLEFLGKSDIRVHVTVPIKLSVSPPTQPFVFEPGVVQQDVKINTWKNDWDTAKCMLGILAIWPYLGPKLMDQDKLDWYVLVLTFLRPTLIVYGALGEALKGGKVPSPGSTCVRPDPNKDEFICTQPFEGGSIVHGGMPRLADLSGRPDGLVLMGDFFWAERLARSFHLASIDIRPFTLGAAHLTCGQAGSSGLAWITAHPDRFAFYQGQISVNFELDALSTDNNTKPVSTSKTNIIPSHICTARVRPEDDPHNVFAPYVTFDDTSPYVAVVQVRVPLASVPDAYFDNPYPCPVLIHTSGGTRMVTLPPITKATDEEIASITVRAWGKRVSECYAKSRRYDPRWIIDPADFYSELHHWDVMVAGLRPGEYVSLQDGVGAVVAAMRANRQGEAWLRALLSPETYDGQLSFRRSSPPARLIRARAEEVGGPMSQEDYVAIDVKQTQLLLKAEIATQEPLLGLVPVMLGSRSGLIVVQHSGISVYDLSQAHQPRQVMQRDLRGLSGAVSTGEEVFAWGERGTFALEFDRELSEIAIEQVSDEPVDAMVSGDRQVFVLRGGRLELLVRGCQEAVFEAPGARHLAATSSHLLVGSQSGVMIHEIAGEGHLRTASEHRFEGLSQILASDFLGRDHEFMLTDGARIEQMDVSDPERPLVLGEDRNPPELGSFTRYRDLLIEGDRDAMSIRVYSAGATAFI